jgi:hypothetical protein
MSIFNCCTCPEPPDYDPGVDDPLDKYINTCGCPSVSVVCESSQKNATMCGVVDPDEETSPTTFYKEGYGYFQGNVFYPEPGYNRQKYSFAYTRDEEGDCDVDLEDECWYLFDGEFYKSREATGTATADDVYIRQQGYYNFINNCLDIQGSGSVLRVDTCVIGGQGNASYTSEFTPTGSFTVSYNDNCDIDCQDDPNNITGIEYTLPTTTLEWGENEGVYWWNANTTLTEERIRDCFGGQNQTNTFPIWLRAQADYPDGDPFTKSGDALVKYDPESVDTEEDSLDAATAVSGTSCLSLYQLRTTSNSFIKRTVTYTATASNLSVGKAYEGCVKIRKREAYSGTPPAGADTEWEDVEPDTISSFTATDTEEEIAADVEVPNVQGYEYQVVSAHVWPVSVGCDCPTSEAP